MGRQPRAFIGGGHPMKMISTERQLCCIQNKGVVSGHPLSQGVGLAQPEASARH